MREIKSQISNLMTRLDHESKTLLSSFSQLQPENEADMTVHSLTALLPPPKQQKEGTSKQTFNTTQAVYQDEKENNKVALDVDQNNYLTLGDLQRVENTAEEHAAKSLSPQRKTSPSKRNRSSTESRGRRSLVKSSHRRQGGKDSASPLSKRSQNTRSRERLGQSGPKAGVYSELRQCNNSQQLLNSTNSHLSVLQQKYEEMKVSHERQQERLEDSIRQGSPMYNRHLQERQKRMQDQAWSKLNQQPNSKEKDISSSSVSKR